MAPLGHTCRRRKHRQVQTFQVCLLRLKKWPIRVHEKIIMALSPPAASRLEGGIRYSVQPLAGSPPAPLLIQDPFTPTSAYCSVSSGAAVFAPRVVPVVVKLTEQENG